MLYALHVLAAVALLLQGLAIAGRLLHVGQHVGHQCLLQPLSHAVHQLLLLPARRHDRKLLSAGSGGRRDLNCTCKSAIILHFKKWIAFNYADRSNTENAHLMSSSVTMKALQSGWAVLSHTPGFFSTAADSWPVMGAALVCKALAMADRRVLSVHPGPTPERPNRTVRGNSTEKKLPTVTAEKKNNIYIYVYL